MGKVKNVDLVVVTCYGRQETLPRELAISKYLEGMACSEGSEHQRYETIFLQLLAGKAQVSDTMDWR